MISQDAGYDPLLFIHVVSGLFPFFLATGPVVLLTDPTKAPGPAVFLFHKARVEISLVIRATHWF